MKSIKTNSENASSREILGFKIDENTVKEISNGNYSSYNMLVIREVQSKDFFENLVVEIKGDTTNAYLVKYIPSNTEATDEHGHGDFEGTIEASKVYGQTCIVCPSQGLDENGDSTGPNQGGGGPPTICIVLYKCYTPDAAFPSLSIPHLSYSGACQQMPFQVCGAYGFGSTSLTGLGNGPGNPNAGPNGGLGSGGNNTTTPNNPIVVPVAPIIKTPAQIKLEFEASLNAAQIAWLNNPLNNDLEYEIIKYLTDNQTFTDVETANPTFVFAQEMIAQIMLNPTLFTSIKPFLIEKQIDDNLLDPCSKSIFQQIKNTINSDISTVLQKLDNPNSTYSTTLVAEIPSQPGATGLTDWVKDLQGSRIPYNYKIQIKPSYINQATKLSVACTIIHEIVHAYFLSIIDDCNIASNCDLLQTFPELWNFYVLHKNGGILTDSFSQHQQMAEIYVNAIAESLKEYAIATGTPSTFEDLDEICSDLAWAGLIGTSVFDSLPEEDKFRIAARVLSEKTNSPATNISDSSILTPIGFPCN